MFCVLTCICICKMCVNCMCTILFLREVDEDQLVSQDLRRYRDQENGGVGTENQGDRSGWLGGEEATLGSGIFMRQRWFPWRQRMLVEVQSKDMKTKKKEV